MIYGVRGRVQVWSNIRHGLLINVDEMKSAYNISAYTIRTVVIRGPYSYLYFYDIESHEQGEQIWHVVAHNGIVWRGSIWVSWIGCVWCDLMRTGQQDQTSPFSVQVQVLVLITCSTILGVQSQSTYLTCSQPHTINPLHLPRQTR